MRKSKEVKITGEAATNRDAGKVFFITEMACGPAEAWTYRAFGAMVRAGIDIPPEVIASGMAGLSMVGLKSFMAAPWSDVESLLADLMTCVRVQTEIEDKENGGFVKRALNDRGDENDDIEEIGTRVRLRDEVFELHTGFSIADTLLSGVSAVMKTMFPDLLDTPTPGEQSES